MRKILLGILIFSSIAVKSQDYKPFNFANGIWIMNYHEYEGPTYDFQYYCVGDTVLNNQTYHKLYRYTIKLWYIWEKYLEYYGAIRNDTANRKIILVENGQDEPEILYNFNLQIGDTVKEGIGKHFDLVVTEIDSILVCNKFHRRYVIQRSQPWPGDQAFIEGIGFSYGFVEPLVIDPFETTSELVCYTEIDNEACEECELLLTNESRAEQKEIRIFPNPAKGILYLALNAQDKAQLQIYIFNYLGQLIENMHLMEVKSEINIQSYPSGIYLFCLIDSQGVKRYSGTFIVEE